MKKRLSARRSVLRHQSHGSPCRLAAAHTKYRLMLLGSPPDMVHGHALRGTGKDCHRADDTERNFDLKRRNSRLRLRYQNIIYEKP